MSAAPRSAALAIASTPKSASALPVPHRTTRQNDTRLRGAGAADRHLWIVSASRLSSGIGDTAWRCAGPPTPGVERAVSTKRYAVGVPDGPPGALLREARRQAGMSQVELGRRAGVTQSVVSAYESGARQPSLPTLQRLVRATGCELDLVLRPPASRPAGAGERLARHRREMKEIASGHGLSNLRVFGSVARGEDGPDSDIDLLVDTAAGVGLFSLARCQRDLEALLGARVDLVPASGLKPGVAGTVLAEARPL